MFNNFSPYSTFPMQSSYDRIAGNQPQQMFNPYQPNQPQQPQSFQQNTNITFVNGIEGAKAYQVSPNSSVLLMDSDNSKFYVKSTDGLGVAKLTSYCFLEEGNSPTESSSSAVAVEGVSLKKEDVDALMNRLNELEDFKKVVEEKIGELLKE